jgi:SnoaL-like domain
MNARQCADVIETAMTTKDLDGLLSVYADDVVFHSPVTAVRFQGKSEVAELMTHVLSGFETWERTFVLAEERECVFGARARIGGRDIELAELIRVDADGRVAEIVIHGRPLAGVAAIAAVGAGAGWTAAASPTSTGGWTMNAPYAAGAMRRANGLR